MIGYSKPNHPRFIRKDNPSQKKEPDPFQQVPMHPQPEQETSIKSL
jgi:hypothetical protein